MKNRHGHFIWYELMTTEPEAAEQFYGPLVNWSFEDAADGDKGYRLFKADGPPVGGVLPLTAEMVSEGASLCGLDTSAWMMWMPA